MYFPRVGKKILMRSEANLVRFRGCELIHNKMATREETGKQKGKDDFLLLLNQQRQGDTYQRTD